MFIDHCDKNNLKFLYYLLFRNFTVLYHSTYGRCYMFNYLGIKPTAEKPVTAYNYGSSSGKFNFL